MEFDKVVAKRKMVRSFLPKKIPSHQVDKILKTMLKSPSAGFSQGIELLAITEQETRDTFFSKWKQNSDKWPGTKNASLIIIVLANKMIYLKRYAAPDKGFTDMQESNWPTPYWFVDGGMSTLLGLLAVVNEELAAVFVGIDDIPSVKKSYKIPQDYHPIGALLVGFPQKDDPPSSSLKRGRRALQEVIHYNFWNETNKNENKI